MPFRQGYSIRKICSTDMRRTIRWHSCAIGFGQRRRERWEAVDRESNLHWRHEENPHHLSLRRRVFVSRGMHSEGEKSNENCLDRMSDIQVYWRVKRTYEDGTASCNSPSVLMLVTGIPNPLDRDILRRQRNGNTYPIRWASQCIPSWKKIEVSSC